MGIATLIASGRLSRGSLSGAADALAQRGLTPGATHWIEADRVCDLAFEGSLVVARKVLEGLIDDTDVVVQAAEGRAKRLLVADMDSTLITVECIDELADFAGRKAEVAAITERAMRGELDFAASLRARVALLAGLAESAIDACYCERVALMPGARTLVATMRAHGAATLLVSGGFTVFADRVAAELGIDEVVANRLAIAGGVLTGEVESPVVDGARKAEALGVTAERLGLSPNAVLAIGDGANDRAMTEAAGLGVAFRAKPVLAHAADARIEHGDLTALLFAQGYGREVWVG